MTLSADELDLLRASFRKLAHQGPGTAIAFYDQLFEVAPETRTLRHGAMPANRGAL